MKRPGTYVAAVTSEPDEESPRGTHANGTRLRRLPGQRRPTRHQVQRTAVTYELNADLVPLIRQLAAALGVSPAGAVDRLLFHALQEFIAGRVDFEPYLLGSRSPQYTWLVDVPAADLQASLTEYLDGYFANGED